MAAMIRHYSVKCYNFCFSVRSIFRHWYISCCSFIRPFSRDIHRSQQNILQSCRMEGQSSASHQKTSSASFRHAAPTFKRSHRTVSVWRLLDLCRLLLCDVDLKVLVSSNSSKDTTREYIRSIWQHSESFMMIKVCIKPLKDACCI